MRDGLQGISKTDYLNWLTCPGYAWAVIHQPDIVPPEDATTLRKQHTGDVIETLARTRFPDATLIDADTPQEAAELTRVAIDQGVSTILHATVITERGLIAEADVLIRTNHGWHLIEIKSSSADPDHPNGMVKKYLPDISFQTAVLTQAGLSISRSSLMHVNRHYRRNGHVDPENALALTDVTAAVTAHLPATHKNITKALTTLQDAEHPAACDCHRNTRAHRCPMFQHFHPEIPPSGTIYTIAGIHRGSLLPAVDRGIIRLVDWPDDLPLTARQRRQVALARSNEEIVQAGPLRSLLGRLRFPLQFLDYETFQQAIPSWEGFAPHQQIPFQYSLHILTEHGTITHHEHLCTTRETNPVPALVDQLRLDMPDAGSVLVWNKTFEESRNREMAEIMPSHAGFLHDINDRMVDLADIVSKGWWVHPAFGGRWSLKSVLPVAAPDLCYDNLDISEGITAAELWMQCMIDDPARVTDQERAGIIEALHEYCAMDTLALVRIREHVQELVANQPSATGSTR